MLQTENLISLAEAARRLPTFNGKRIAVSTIWRWALHGQRGVRLETRRLGRRLLTSREALDRFAAKLAELPPNSPAPRTPAHAAPKGRTPAQRKAALARANAELRAAGFTVPDAE